jgi:hypothetical protein
MKTHTHTQGPWHLGKRGGNPAIYGKDGTEVAEILHGLTPEWRANARLIAAAPEMLAALESISIGLSPASVELQMELQMETLADLCRVCREIAENALAKAKGGDA